MENVVFLFLVFKLVFYIRLHINKYMAFVFYSLFFLNEDSGFRVVFDDGGC